MRTVMGKRVLRGVKAIAAAVAAAVLGWIVPKAFGAAATVSSRPLDGDCGA
jgi:hypothetical protein